MRSARPVRVGRDPLQHDGCLRRGPELPELLLGLRLLVRMGDQHLLSVRGLHRHAVRRGAVRVVGDPRATLRWRDLLVRRQR